MKKLYILGTEKNGMGSGEGIYNLIADDCEFMSSHFCSHAGYAEGDLWRNRENRIEEWKKRFGEFEVVWLVNDEMTLETLLERNKKWGESQNLTNTEK